MDIVVKDTDKKTCYEMVNEHHSYMEKARHNASVDHSIHLDGELVGIIQYAYLACSSEIAGYDPSETLSLTRMCFSVDKKNLATAAMSKSIGKMKHEYAREQGIELLVSYSRSDYEGTVYKAFGFEKDGVSRGKFSPFNMIGNKPKRDIYTRRKVRWVFELF